MGKIEYHVQDYKIQLKRTNEDFSLYQNLFSLWRRPTTGIIYARLTTFIFVAFSLFALSTTKISYASFCGFKSEPKNHLHDFLKFSSTSNVATITLTLSQILELSIGLSTSKLELL